MQKDKQPIFVAGFIFLILIINFAAMKFHWYYTIAWFDMPMHFLGGLWIGFALFYFARGELSFVKFIGWVLGIGVLWEVFELFNNHYFGTQDPFDLLDTLSDFLFDLLGGTAAYLMKQKR
ncbi:MAG: hypothetical protein AAB500_01430 [Patescibacteria group bacterium]